MRKIFCKLIVISSIILTPLTTLAQKIPDWKLGVSLELMDVDLQTYKYAKAAGIDCLEISMPRFKSTGVAEMIDKVALCKKYADEAGLIIWSIHIPYGWEFDISLPDPIKQEQNRQYILFTLDIAKGLGNYSKVILHPSFEAIDPAKRDAHIKSFREVIGALSHEVESKYGARIAVENLPRTCLGNTTAEMKELIGDISTVDVCFDTNHLLSEKSEYMAAELGSRIKTIHISDYDEIDERHWIPGKGVINWSNVVKMLAESGYEGPFMFEVTDTPWKGDSKRFFEDLVSSWQDIKTICNR